MKLEEVKPAHCYARVARLRADVGLVLAEMGRTADARPAPEVNDARPRACYALAIACWHKVARLADELGARAVRPAPAMPALASVAPGHVLELVDAIAAQLDDIKVALQISEHSTEPAIESQRQPSDVLALLFRVVRDVSRALDQPFTPGDVHRVVALAAAYAARASGSGTRATFERRKQPADCYRALERGLARAAALAGKRGHGTIVVRGTPADVAPGDVYDLAHVVLGEVALVHEQTPNAVPLSAVEPGGEGHALPSHVHQLAATLDAILAAM
jgi:hypothetical protein